ncbi:carbamate kinase [Catenulispora sp. MAP12-49]|uniref:carbamate kinase n=1 Tax=Catenulispora sp. MAP12-49 TaxID=3156302 RepID=UPI003516ED9C
MRIMVALGGNALLERGEKPDAEIQREHVRRAAAALAPLARDHQLIICHGNGPQVGVLAVESEADPNLSRPYPLDLLVAQTQGMIGYWLVQELQDAGVEQPAVAVLTRVVVDRDDPAFARPTKFIGSGYRRDQAERLAAERGWSIAADGERWRRVVPSPRPLRIPELASITGLLEAGTIVVCGGGGGIPVAEDASGGLVGVEAVVDKDLTAAHLAVALDADRLLVLTDVSAVMRDFGTPRATPIRSLGLADLADLHLPAGSMGPKIQACEAFTTATGRPSAIGALTEAAAILAGSAGTTIRAHGPAPVEQFGPVATGSRLVL